MSSQSALVGLLIGPLIALLGIALVSVPAALIVAGVVVTALSALFVDVGDKS